MLKTLTAMVLALVMLGGTAQARHWRYVRNGGWTEYAYYYTGNFESDDTTFSYSSMGEAGAAYHQFIELRDKQIH